MKPGLEDALKRIKSYSEELGLDLNKSEDRFKWLIASTLFAKRISSSIAKRTFEVFLERGLTSPEAILRAGWDELVNALDEGGYVRYDFSTATNILELVKALLKKYGGVDGIHEASRTPEELEARLMELRGVGPTAVNIFLRELRGVWSKARPKVSDKALAVAQRLGLSLEEAERYESKLVRIHLELCKKRRCIECPVHAFCNSSYS